MPDPTPPPYLPAVLGLATSAPPGRVTDVFVLHDDDCPLLTGGECRCTPTVTRGFCLWRRVSKGRGRAWDLVATVATEREAWALVKGSADFCVLPAGQEP